MFKEFGSVLSRKYNSSVMTSITSTSTTIVVGIAFIFLSVTSQFLSQNPYFPGPGFPYLGNYFPQNNANPYYSQPSQPDYLTNTLSLGNHRQVVPAPSQAVVSSPAPVRAGYSVKDGSYVLRWEVSGNTITFNATRKGSGFIGFAISPNGGMSGADIFMAGIDPTGRPFAQDYHHEYLPGGEGSAQPDPQGDYVPLEVSESNGYTVTRFQRLLDTGDRANDIVIQNKEQYILWSLGPPSRGLEYHGPTNRGSVKINLLNPPKALRLK